MTWAAAFRPAPAGRRHSGRGPTAAPGLPCEPPMRREAVTPKLTSTRNQRTRDTKALQCSGQSGVDRGACRSRVTHGAMLCIAKESASAQNNARLRSTVDAVRMIPCSERQTFDVRSGGRRPHPDAPPRQSGRRAAPGHARQRIRGRRLLPYWQQLTPKYDVLVFDFRNHGQNVPVEPSNHHLRAACRDLERVVQAVDATARQQDDRGHLPFHVGAHRHEARHRDRLALGRARAVRSAQRPAATTIRSYEAMEMFENKLTEWALGRRRRFDSVDELAKEYRASRATERWVAGRARADGALGAAQRPGRRRLRAGLRAGERSQRSMPRP